MEDRCRTTGAVVLDGASLRPEDVEAVARRGVPVALDPAAAERMRRARVVAEAALGRGDRAYGLSTGVGVRRRVRVDADAVDRFNHRLIADHRMAQGPPAPPDVVRATMVRLANGLARGTAGVRPRIVERLVEALNDGETPPVRLLGSTGTGDLAPHADLAHALFAAIPLRAMEALPLLSNSSFSTALATLALRDAERLAEAMTAAVALDMEAFVANPSPLHPVVGRSRPHPGLVRELARLREELDGSALWEPGVPRHLQDPLSFRGAPQVLGALRDALTHLRRVVAVELNASQENPVVVVEEERLVSVGNYEIQPLATALDLARIALAPAIATANERLVKLLQAPQTGLTDGLAPVDAPHESGLSEYTWPAQALAAEARLLAAPVSGEVGSASQAEGIEDRITMAPLAARRLAEMVRLGANVVAIELVVAAQAVELRHGPAPAGLGAGARRSLALVRSEVPFVGPGDHLAPDLEPLCARVRDGAFGPPT